MFAKNSYLVMAVMFLIFGIYSFQNNNSTSANVFVWFSIVFCFFWLIHFLKVNFGKDYAPFFVRDSFLKYCLFGILLFPFLLIKYLSLLMQSFSKEEPISQITDRIFIGQQLLWFHQKVFKDKNIGAVLDITVEGREPFFITMNNVVSYLRMPVLDKTSPSLEQLEKGVQWGLNQIGEGKNLYVHCGAGHERSATFVSAVLLRSKRCKTVEESMSLIKQNRSKARFVDKQEAILKKWLVANHSVNTTIKS
jgi:Dual specificity phosphatase, catalytic domain